MLMPAMALFALTTPETCFVPDVPDPALCYHVSVPANHDQADGAMIKLPVAVLPARGSPKAPDPVFLLVGGPGEAATRLGLVAEVALAQVRKRRDVVLLDQRGTTPGVLPCVSTPSFDLNDTSAFLREILRCRTQWRFDLYQLNTLTLARDTEAVRQALGYQQINLWGGSYGTRLAQEYIRQFPNAVRSAVLDAVVAPDSAIPLTGERYAEPAFQAMLQQCADHQACAQQFPNLPRLLPDLLQKLRSQALTGRWPDPVTGLPTTYTITADAVIAGVRGLLYSASLRASLPLVLSALAQGDAGPWLALTATLNTAVIESMAFGQTLSVVCADDGVGLSEALIIAQSEAFTRQTGRVNPFASSYASDWLRFCRAWQSPPAKLSTAMINTPILMISGALDPVTPPAAAEAAAKFMRRSQHIVVAQGFHINSTDGCLPRLVGAFIEAGTDQKLDADCVRHIQVPAFSLPLSSPDAVHNPASLEIAEGSSP
jgi:pimeloyl-ACP methyl ester carboxylesterase